MKKVIAFVAVVVCFSVTTAMAQGGGGQQMTPEQRTAMMKERYKAMGLNDVQTDSVIAISNDLRALRPTRETPEDQRATKMKEFTDAMQKRLDKAIGADLAKKVIEGMAQRPGGGRGGGGK
ncbi:MAG: hypothetical protein V4450_14175 [Bacteroidota bacterium]